MKTRRLLVSPVRLVAVAIRRLNGLTSYWQRQQAMLKDAQVVVMRVQCLTRQDRAARSPSLRLVARLIDGGYVRSATSQCIDGIELTIHSQPKKPGHRRF